MMQKLHQLKAIEDYGEKLSKEAIELAHHTGRKTITGADIKLAIKI